MHEVFTRIEQHRLKIVCVAVFIRGGHQLEVNAGKLA